MQFKKYTHSSVRGPQPTTAVQLRDLRASRSTQAGSRLTYVHRRRLAYALIRSSCCSPSLQASLPCLHRWRSPRLQLHGWCSADQLPRLILTNALHTPLKPTFELAMMSLHTVRADRQAVQSAIAAGVLVQTAVATVPWAAAVHRRFVYSADPIHAPCVCATTAHQPPCCTLQPSASSRRAGQAEAGLQAKHPIGAKLS